MCPNEPTWTEGTPKSSESSGPVFTPRLFGSILLLTSIVCEIELKPSRVSRSVLDASVEFQTTPTRYTRVGSATELKKSFGCPGATISPVLPDGADCRFVPQNNRSLIVFVELRL